MTLHVFLHTLTTGTPVKGDIVVFWQNQPACHESKKPKRLIDATPLSIEQITSTISSLQEPIESITLVGPDILLPLKQATLPALLFFIRALSQKYKTTVILNSDDSLRTGDHDVLVNSLIHSADSVRAVRGIPSGRDKEFAGVIRITRGVMAADPASVKEGERLYQYKESLMDAVI